MEQFSFTCRLNFAMLPGFTVILPGFFPMLERQLIKIIKNQNDLRSTTQDCSRPFLYYNSYYNFTLYGNYLL